MRFLYWWPSTFCRQSTSILWLLPPAASLLWASHYPEADPKWPLRQLTQIISILFPPAPWCHLSLLLPIPFPSDATIRISFATLLASNYRSTVYLLLWLGFILICFSYRTRPTLVYLSNLLICLLPLMAPFVLAPWAHFFNSQNYSLLLPISSFYSVAFITCQVSTRKMHTFWPTSYSIIFLSLSSQTRVSSAHSHSILQVAPWPVWASYSMDHFYP